MWDDTLVVVTSDHGEQLGDQGTLGKGGPFESSYHILGIVRDPRHPEAARTGRHATSPRTSTCSRPSARRSASTSPPSATACRSRRSCEGEHPPWWRDAAHWEYDWRWEYISRGPHPWPWDRRLEAKHLAVLRSESAAYVQYGDGAVAVLRPRRPTRGGAPRSPTPEWCSSTPRPC